MQLGVEGVELPFKFGDLLLLHIEFLSLLENELVFFMDFLKFVYSDGVDLPELVFILGVDDLLQLFYL